MMESFSFSPNSSSLIILTKRSLPSTTTTHNQIFLPQRHPCLSFKPISCTSSDDSSNTTSDETTNSVQAPTATAPTTSAADISFRRRSRRQARRQREDESMQSAKRVSESPPKKWEEMSLSEKAVELYMGEKGALFWLNKFAYASIFIMIGGWIMFRFVGPALNIYQLDGPVLSPSDVFK